MFVTDPPLQQTCSSIIIGMVSAYKGILYDFPGTVGIK